MDECSWHFTGGGDQDHPQEKEMQKGKMVEEALKIAEKRREAKGKGEKERYTIWMQSCKEEQGEIRKPSSLISAKKWKTIQWEKLEISSKN